MSLDDDVNHFNKDYFGKGKDGTIRWLKEWSSHTKRLKRCTRWITVKSTNATAGGKLEVLIVLIITQFSNESITYNCYRR